MPRSTSKMASRPGGRASSGTQQRAALARRTAGRRAHGLVGGRWPSCRAPAPAWWGRRHGCALPPSRAPRPARGAAQASPCRRPPSRPWWTRRSRRPRAHRCRFAGSAAGAGRTSPPGSSPAAQARSRAMGWNGAGGWVIRSRTVCTTFHCRGTTSSVSVTSSPSLPWQHGQAVGPGIITRSRGRCAGKNPRTGLRRMARGQGGSPSRSGSSAASSSPTGPAACARARMGCRSGRA